MPVDREDAIVSTSVYKLMMTRMRDVHRQGVMGAFAGPPGLGKTTVAHRFVADQAGAAVLVTPTFPNAKLVLTLQSILAEISPWLSAAGGKRELAASLGHALRDWHWSVASKSDDPSERSVPLTIVIDEAQNLAPETIEGLRFWNDHTDEDVPKIAFVFLGNQQFYLEGGSAGASFLSAAVRSRTPYRKTFTYRDLTDDDLTLIIEQAGVTDADAVALLLRHCRRADINRDLRVLSRDLKNLVRPGIPTTVKTVAEYLGGA